MTSLYTTRKIAPGVLTITKLDEDYNAESSYMLTADEKGNAVCTCPASDRPTCRHRKMLPLFITSNHIDDGWFLEWETRLWRQPLGGAEMADHTMMGENGILAGEEPVPPPPAAPAVEPHPKPAPVGALRLRKLGGSK